MLGNRQRHRPCAFLLGSPAAGPRNAFFKKIESPACAAALHMVYYDVVRMRSKLRMTPAMAAGASDRLWEIGDTVWPVEVAEEAVASGSVKKAGVLRMRSLGVTMTVFGLAFLCLAAFVLYSTGFSNGFWGLLSTGAVGILGGWNLRLQSRGEMD